MDLLLPSRKHVLRCDVSNVTAQIGNLYVPRALADAGEVPVVLTVDGVTANVVTISVQ